VNRILLITVLISLIAKGQRGNNIFGHLNSTYTQADTIRIVLHTKLYGETRTSVDVRIGISKCTVIFSRLDSISQFLKSDTSYEKARNEFLKEIKSEKFSALKSEKLLRNMDSVKSKYRFTSNDTIHFANEDQRSFVDIIRSYSNNRDPMSKDKSIILDGYDLLVKIESFKISEEFQVHMPDAHYPLLTKLRESCYGLYKIFRGREFKMF